MDASRAESATRAPARALHPHPVMMKSSLHPDMLRERLRELCARHHGTVRRVCWRYVQNGLDADDLAQETLLRAARAFDGFAGAAATSTWLHRIAVNRCLDHLRARSRMHKALERFLDEAPDTICPSTELHRLHAQALLETLEAELGEADRAVARLCLEEGLSQRAAAERLRVSRGAVEKRLARVRARAARIWKRMPPPPPSWW